jgi:hypothetical protein
LICVVNFVRKPMSLTLKHLNLYPKYLLRAAMLLFLSVSVCGCSSLTNLQGNAPASLTFAHIAPANIPVKNISISSSAPLEGHVPDSFVMDVDDWLSSYFSHKIKPDDELGGGILSVNIQDLRLSERYEPHGSAVVRFFELSGYDVYTLEIQVDVRADDITGFETYGTRMEFERSVKVPEHASLAQRDVMQTQLVEQLTLDLDHEVEQFLHAVFR